LSCSRSLASGCAVPGTYEPSERCTITGCPPTTVTQDTTNAAGGVSAPRRPWTTPIFFCPGPEPQKEETASADEKSGDLPIKVVTGEKDADGTDPGVFDVPDVGDSPPEKSPEAISPTEHVVAAPKRGMLAPSPSEVVSDTPEPEMAPPGPAEAPTAEIIDLESGRVRL